MTGIGHTSQVSFAESIYPEPTWGDRAFAEFAASPAAVDVASVQVVASPPAVAPLERTYLGAALPPRAAAMVLVGFATTLALSALILAVARSWTASHPGLEWLQVLTTLGAVVAQYGVMIGLCLLVSRCWGTASLRADLGMSWRARDLPDGLVGWLAGMGLVAVLLSALRATGIPFVSNNPLAGGSRGGELGLPQGAAVALVGVIMVVVAPVLEELLFRGVLLRALAGWWPTPWALLAQAVAFGCFHVSAGRGWGNVGLVVVLSGVGLMLGVLTHRRAGRLGSAMVAHALHNAVAFSVGVAALT